MRTRRSFARSRRAPARTNEGPRRRRRHSWRGRIADADEAESEPNFWAATRTTTTDTTSWARTSSSAPPPARWRTRIPVHHRGAPPRRPSPRLISPRSTVRVGSARAPGLIRRPSAGSIRWDPDPTRRTLPCSRWTAPRTRSRSASASPRAGPRACPRSTTTTRPTRTAPTPTPSTTCSRRLRRVRLRGGRAGGRRR